MAEFSTFMENVIINHLLRNQAHTPPAIVYVGLYTVPPTDAGGGTEVIDPAYARQNANLTASTTGESANAGDITFPVASEDWGQIKACGLFNAVSGGDLLMWSELDAYKTVNTGDIFKFNLGDLDVIVD
jgi:hypothetical protein